jgi:hypothetical protein
MGLDFQVDGQAQLRKLAAHIRATGNKGLGREFARALEKAVEPVKKSIVASAEQTMPSGYRETLTRSLKHRRTTRASARQASVRLATYGDGKSERRDLPALNKGTLRHPVFGRSRPTRKGRKSNPWAVTSIRAGFHDRAIEDAGDKAEQALRGVLDDFAERLAKG